MHSKAARRNNSSTRGRSSRIVLAAGITIAVIAAVAGPAVARASASGQASTPVPVDITGDITWTWDHTPQPPGETVTGDDKQTGTFHIDLTNVTTAGVDATVGGDSSTYSITDNSNISRTDSTGCTHSVTGSYSGSGPLPYASHTGPAGITSLEFSGFPSITAITELLIDVQFSETQTFTSSGSCGPGTSTVPSGLLTADPRCFNSAAGDFQPLSGSLQGTWPNATVDLGCSGTYANCPERSTCADDSGSYSVTGILTITPSCGSAAASSLTPASPASATSAHTATSASAYTAAPTSVPSSNSCPGHYTVTVEDWIPQSSVVDPFMPVPIPYLSTLSLSAYAVDPNCLQPPLPRGIYHSIVRSSFHGDGHPDFGGSYRVEFGIAFDFDGQSITNFQVIPPRINPTVRNKTYTAGGKVIASCSASGLAKFRGGAEQTSDTSFTINSGGANPLVRPAPAFSIAVSGSLNDNGDLRLSLDLTDFPSGGIQVTKNGQDVLTDVANDVSCLPPSEVTGPRGATTLLEGLLRSHAETATASASAGALSEDIPSPLCYGG
jgi:hypothetical protein